MNYTSDYFIKKLSAIPSEKWISTHFEKDGKSCVNGHLGLRCNTERTPEGMALTRLFNRLECVEVRHGSYVWRVDPDTWGYSNRAACINNGDCVQYQQDTPKDRVLAALLDIKAMEAVDEANGIISEPINIKQNESKLHAYFDVIRPFRVYGDYQTIYNRGIQQLHQRPEERAGRAVSLACTV